MADKNLMGMTPAQHDRFMYLLACWNGQRWLDKRNAYLARFRVRHAVWAATKAMFYPGWSLQSVVDLFVRTLPKQSLTSWLDQTSRARAKDIKKNGSPCDRTGCKCGVTTSSRARRDANVY